MANLRVRDQQLAVLQTHAFINMVKQELQNRLPEGLGGHPSAEVESLITDSIKKAKAAGLTDGWDVYRYVEYQFRLGRDYEALAQYSALAEVISAKELNGGARMDWLDYYYEAFLKPGRGNS